MKKNSLEKYIEVAALYTDDKYSKKLLFNTETYSYLFKHEIAKNGPGYYRQLADHEQQNLPRLRKVSDGSPGTLTVIEEYLDGETLQTKIRNGISDDELLDCLFQLCDAISFLAEQKPPIYHTAIDSSMILIDGDSVLKLTKLEHLSNQGSLEDTFRQIGVMLRMMGGRYRKKFKKIIRKCENGYTKISQLNTDLLAVTKSAIMRIYTFIGMAVLFAFLLYRVFSRFLPAIRSFFQ